MNKQSIAFNLQQQAVINHTKGPAMVLAVPGAGKTTVTIFRTAKLILEEKVSANRILSLTFSKMAANDMKNKYVHYFADQAAIPHFSTIHSFSYSILRDYGKATGKSYRLIDGGFGDTDKYKLLRQIYQSVNNVFLTEDKMEELINQISYCNNFRLSPSDADFRGKIKNFDSIYTQYSQYKKMHGLIDFDDMLIYGLEILETNPAFKRRYQSYFDYIQVDEAQDTSVLQQNMIDLLAEKHQNILMVADDDQSIYSFRGASPEGLFDFKEKYPESTLYFMEDNYRSSKDIVLASNQFIKQNYKRYQKEMKYNKSYTDPLYIHKFADEYEQLTFLAESLSSHPEAHKAVLARTNLSLIPIANQLMKENISYHIKDIKHSFFNHWIVNDMIAILLFAMNPMDYKALEHFYYKLNLYIAKASIQHLLSLKNQENAFDILCQSPNLKLFQIEQLKIAKQRFIFLSKLKPVDAIDFILSELQYEKYLNSYADMINTNVDGYKKVISTIKMLAIHHTELSDFIIHMKNLKQSLNTPQKNARITLSTVHSAKGLEFDEVYLIDLLDDEFPVSSSSFTQSKQDELEEERRLFYVGLTRAKKALHLCTYYARCNEPVKPSSFLQNVVSLSEGNLDISNVDDFMQESVAVVHRVFGRGKIISAEGDRLSIYFEGEGRKELSKQLCLEMNLLKPL